MPSPEKTARIYEICAEYDLDYFGNEDDRETIEYMLIEEFPDEFDLEFDSESSEVDEGQHEDMRTWRNVERGEPEPEEESTVGYWLLGLGILIFLIVVFWEYIVTFLLILGVLLFFGIKGLFVLLAGGATSSGSSHSYKSSGNVTYGLQRASGAVWYTIAQGPENWMIDKLEQNRAKDNARYRVVMLVNGKASGTTYS